MVTIASYCDDPTPTGYPAIEAHSLRSFDQWVRTRYNDAVVIGRILAVLHTREGALLYEVELPLANADHGRMMHVARYASELHSIGHQTVADIPSSH